MRNILKTTYSICLLIASLVTASAQTNLYTSTASFAAAINGINTIRLTLPVMANNGSIIASTNYSYGSINYKSSGGSSSTMYVQNDGIFGNTTYLEANAIGFLTLTLNPGYNGIYFQLGDQSGNASAYNISVNGGSPFVYNLSGDPDNNATSGFVGIVDKSTTINTLKISIDPNSPAYGDPIDIFGAPAVTPTPEPSTVALAAMGSLTFCFFWRRHR